MNRKIKVLLAQLALTDINSSDFLDLSKKIAEAVRVEQKEKIDRVPKEPKTPKPKAKKTVVCDDCLELVNKKLKELEL
jgi:hypothetical protein